MDLMKLVSRNLIPLLVGVSLLASWATAQNEEDDPVWFDYEAEPSVKNRIQSFSVTLSESGLATVHLRVPTKEIQEYETRFSSGELDFVKTLVRSVAFFDLPEKGNQERWTHPTRVHLKVKLDGRYRKLEYLNTQRPELVELTKFAERMLIQAQTHIAIKNGDSFTANFSPLLVGGKPFQPYKFTEPIKTLIRKIENSGKVRRLFAHLAYVTTPEQFVGFYAAEIKRRPEFLHLPLLGNIPKKHSEALYPFYLLYLRDIDAREKTPRESDSWARSQFVSRLGDARYLPALPYFLQRLGDLEKRGDSFFHPLAKFGLPSVTALIPFLDHEKGFIAETSADLIELAARLNPEKYPSIKTRDFEYSQIIELIKKKALPKMKRMVEEKREGINHSYLTKIISNIEKYVDNSK